MNGDNAIEEKSREMQLIISKTLLYGVILATVIVLVGVILMLVDGETGYNCDLSSLNCILSYNSATIPHGLYPNSLFSLISGTAQGRPFAIIEVGLVVLLATPVIRVATSVLVFVAEKDRMFVTITIGVLLILLFSFFVVPLISLFHA